MTNSLIRYIILPLLTFYFGLSHLHSQVVWTEPAFPTQFDDVTIYYDASQGNAALEGFTGDVFAHTGVITSESANGNDWKYVIGNWGAQDARVLMTRLDENLYSISYNITDFYGVPAHEEVLQMAFVFRNVNGTIVGRSADGSDIFTNVYPSEEGLFLTVHSPEGADHILFEEDSLLIDVEVSDTAIISIYDNDVLLQSTTGEHLEIYYHPPSTGHHNIKIEAVADTTVFVEKKIIVLTHNPVRIDPPAGTRNGLNYFTDSTYVFRLHAPLKEYAFVLTPANHYQADTAFLMHVGQDNASFWIELRKDLFTEDRNTYQYLVDDQVRVADPHSEVVLDPFHDAWVRPSVLNELAPYPEGMTTGIVTAFDIEYQPFPFTDSFVKPEKTNLVIYEMLLRDFLANHSFPTLLDTLDYFQRLGVTAIQLMPVSEFEGNDSWGYNQSFHMAVDKYYGSRDELKAFIDAAHQRGIAVILDVVYNHTFSQGPLAQMYWDATNFRPSAESPYLNVVPRHPFNVGYDFNHESQATKIWVKRILQHWITEFRFDGFRFDLSKGLTQFNSGNDVGLMGRYDASRIAILKDYADYIWSLDPGAYVIMEHFADNDEEIELSNYGMMLWGNMNHGFGLATRGYQSDLEWADYTVRGWDNPHLITYMESHDEERLMFRLLNEGDSEGDYNTRHFQTALERMAAAAAIFYTIPGSKMMWQFGDLGYEFSINRCVNGTISNDCRLDPKPIRWDYLEDYYRRRLHEITADIIYLKTNYPTFSTEDFDFNDANLYIKTIHFNHPDMDAVTLANFRVTASDINPKFQYTGTWYEYFTGDSVIVTDTQDKLPFAPGEYRIYTSKRITPPNGFSTSINNPSLGEITLFPNTIREGDEVFGFIAGTYEITGIRVMDVNGREVKVNADVEPHHFSLRFDASAGAGMYFVQVQTDNGWYIGKIVRQ